MLHRTVELDFERIHPVRHRPTADHRRTALAEIQTTARDILAGRRVVRSPSPRTLARYGRTMPTLVGLHHQIGYDRTFKLGHKLRMALYRGEEFESFIERRQDFRATHYATGLRRRRAAHTRRTI